MTDMPSDNNLDRLIIDDNALIVELAGPHDRNLALIEDATGARIDPRGNEFAISGGEGARERARSALKALHDRLKAGLMIEPADVRAAAGEPLGQRKKKNTDAAVSGSIIIKTPKRTLAPQNESQATYLETLRENELAFGVGPAGTGKTYLAVAHAVSLLLSGAVERLILSRPAIEAGERIGYLPGDMKEKVDPYLRPLYDALYDMMHKDYVERRIEAGDIEIAPLAFMRGRTLARAAVILDEAQNATVAQTKMFLTRLGEGSHMTLTGDPSQSDLPRGEISGLADALSLLGGVKGVGVSTFTSRDVVRHPLVARILEKYEARDASHRTPGG